MAIRLRSWMRRWTSGFSAAGWSRVSVTGTDPRAAGRRSTRVSMFKALILQAQHNLSDARMEFMIRDRLSWMRFLGFDLGGPTPDENTIRLFRDKLTDSGALKRVMKAFDWQLRKKGYIPMSGQIVDASLVPAPTPRENRALMRMSSSAGRGSGTRSARPPARRAPAAPGS